MQSAFKETPDVKSFLFNPVVADQRKRELLSSLANDAGLSKHTLNFLNLLLDQASHFVLHPSIPSSRANCGSCCCPPNV